MNIFKKFIVSGIVIYMDHRTWLFTNILVVIALTTLALMIFDIVFVLSFNAIFKKHQKSIQILLYLKCDNIKNILEMLADKGIEIDEKTKTNALEIQRNDLDEPGSQKFENCMNNLTYLSNSVASILNRNKSMLDEEEFRVALQNIKDSDKQFRTIVTMYNADCLGYNYWISFYPTRFIWKVFRFKPRKLIEL